MRPMPERPATRPSHVEETSFPRGVISPRPVTTTRRISLVCGFRGESGNGYRLDYSVVERNGGHPIRDALHHASQHVTRPDFDERIHSLRGHLSHVLRPVD